MVHIYDGEPDGRQGDANVKTSRFRPRYRALTDEEKALHDAIKLKAEELEDLYVLVIGPGRYSALALTPEQSIMWIVKCLTV